MKIKILIFFITFILFFSTIKGITGNPTLPVIFDKLVPATGALENGPELGRYMHTFALAETHSYALTREMVDKGPDYGYFNGKYFSFFAPGIPYIVLPIYLLGQHFSMAQLTVFTFVILISVINLIVLYQICIEIFSMKKWIALVVLFIFGFGCTSLSYATTLYQHPFTIFSILTSFYAIWRYKKQTKFSSLWAILVWSNYGLAISYDYPNAVLLLPIMVYFLISSFWLIKESNLIQFHFRKSFFITSIFFILLIGVHGYHNKIYFNSWTKISSGLVSLKSLREANVFDTPNIESYLNSKAAAPETNKVEGFLKEKNIPYSFYTLLFGPGKGLLVFSPIFLLAFFGMYRIRKNFTIEYYIILSIFLVNLFFYSSWGDPWGGWAYGPRYLIPSMAALSIFVGVFLQYSKNILSKLSLFILFAYSAAISFLGALTTNQVRPVVEDDGLSDKHTFFFNLKFLKENKSSSFIYNTFLSNKMSLIEYYLIIYSVVIIIFLLILFLLPYFEKENHES